MVYATISETHLRLRVVPIRVGYSFPVGERKLYREMSQLLAFGGFGNPD